MKYYNTEEVAEILGVSVRSIYNYIDEGKLKAYKVGWGWRFKETDIDNFVTRTPSKEVKKEEGK